MLALMAMTLGACERRDPATGLVSHPLLSTESDDRDYRSVSLDQAEQVSIVLGEGNWLEGFDVIRFDCTVNTCTVTKAWRVPPSSQYKWAVQTQSISRDAFGAITALLEDNDWREMKARYASNVHDGTTILLKITADGITKETSADNHFPRELLRIVKGMRDAAPSPESVEPMLIEDDAAYARMQELLSPQARGVAR